jgi:hypothetical protein
MSNRAEGTFGRLRYLLGGDRPSQTAHLTLSLRPLPNAQVRRHASSGWYPNAGSTQADARASSPPTYPVQNRRVLHIKLQSSSTGSFRLAAGNLHLHR